MAALLAAATTTTGCGASTQETTITVTQPPLVVTGTPTVVMAGSLSLTIAGQPERTFLVFGGRWRVCDKGTVINQGTATAQDVRIVATYVDKGVVVGQASRDDAQANGGALGDIPAGASRAFTYCGIAHNEPDFDRLEATTR